MPVDSVANGIVASCEVEIDHLEGAFVFDEGTAPKAKQEAMERDVMGRATAAVTEFRACAGR